MEAHASVDQLVPHDLDAERSVLGSILLDPEAFGRVVQIVNTADHFYTRQHQSLFDAMMALFDRDEPIDVLLLKAELEKNEVLEKVGGLDYLMSLAEAVPSAASADYYAGIVKQKSVMRTIIHAGDEMSRLARSSGAGFREVLDEVERQVLAIGQGLVQGEARRMDDLLKDAFERLEAMQARGGAITGVPTGFHELDELINGFQGSQLIVVAGRPSMGKTTFCLNAAEHIAVEQNTGVLIFSLEMSAENLVENMLCSRAQVNVQKLKRGLLGDRVWARLGETAADLGPAPIFIDATPGMTAIDIRAKARRLKQTEDIGLIVIDYLQLLELGGAGVRGKDNRQLEIATISRGLKSLARELDVPVIAISQLNRSVEQRSKEDFRPRMSDLRESGAIEQDADVILFLYRDEYYHRDREESKGMAEVICAKQRNGATGAIDLNFTGEFMRFRNLARAVEDL